MSQLTQSQVISVLQTVKDPDKGLDIVSLGMVSDIIIHDKHVTFAIEVDPAKGTQMESLRQEAERAVAAIAGVVAVSAVLTATRPSPPPSRPATLPRTTPANPTPISGIRTIIAVASGKGGVGKSTIAVNLALALAEAGNNVGLMDADVYGPSLPRMLGLSGQRPQVTDVTRQLIPLEAHGIRAMSMGFLMADETPAIWRGPMVQGAVRQFLREVAWGTLDVLLVDMPPGTGDAQLTLVQQVPLAGVVIVSTPQDVALADALKSLAMFRRLDVPVLGIIENMSYFSCPHCGSHSNIFSHGGAHAQADRLNIPFLGEVPLDIRIRETSDAGTPTFSADPSGPPATTFRKLARALQDSLDATRRR